MTPVDLPPPAIIELATSNRPGNPQLAVQAEFDAAKRQGTVAAWDLFLARHPDNQLARKAAQERARLLQPGRP